jgi:hypothetical protein
MVNGLLQLVRALTPDRQAPAADRPKIGRLEKSKGFVEPIRVKLCGPDNSVAHLLRYACQRTWIKPFYMG